MPNTWGIEILIKDGMVVFRPDLPDAQIGQPLGVSANDLVLWINRTDLSLALVSAEPPGLFLANPIPPGKGSRPFFVVLEPNITYHAMNAADIASQSHTIQVMGLLTS